MEQMAEGAKAGGATIDVKRIAEPMPDDDAKSMHYKLDQKAQIAARIAGAAAQKAA